MKPPIRRSYEPRLKQLLKTFPIVTLLGPRQSGKTTLARTVLSGWSYLDLERPSDLDRLAIDPEHFLASASLPMVIDEAQRMPALFPLLRSIVDEKPNHRGRFLLLGSASPLLIRGISESLAGRTGHLEMTPFLLSEVLPRKKDGLNSLWLKGGFPKAFLSPSHEQRWDWMESYLVSFLERDLPSYGVTMPAALMRRLLIMVAHVHGGLWNASEIGSSLGVSYHSSEKYLDILEKSFLVRKLLPYYENIGKRLVKAPKVYLRDSGVLHHLVGIKTPQDLLHYPRRGASWEGFLIEQIIGIERLTNPSSQFFFWRTQAGAEVDLLIHRGKEIIPIEIKTTKTPSAHDVRGLRECLKDLKIKKGYVITPTETAFTLTQDIEVLPPGEFFRKLV